MALVHWMALSLSALIAPRTSPAPDVVWIDLAGVPALAEQAARGEAEAVLKQVGLAPRWRVGAPSDMVGPHDLPLVLVRRDHARRKGAERVLGACTPRSTSPRAWVYLENLAFVMGIAHHDGPLAPQEALRLGRAIGRIVAHEVIHAVAPAVEHSRSGIMSSSFDRQELLAVYLAVDAATQRGVQAVLATARASWAPPRS